MDFNIPLEELKPEEPKLPPCAAWDVWKGPEIEGYVSKGVQTLFIRSLAKFPDIKPTDDLSFLRRNSGCKRVWFCKEFTNWGLLKAIGAHFDEVCIEVEPKCLLSIPERLRRTARIYLKIVLPVALKTGDHVCVGLPFADESFEIGKGARVAPKDYLRDIKII